MIKKQPSSFYAPKTIEELCSLITKENQHKDVWGDYEPVGKEVW